ncbi:19677_t:CDS:2, partial [Racocetra fulgida]
APTSLSKTAPTSSSKTAPTSSNKTAPTSSSKKPPTSLRKKKELLSKAHNDLNDDLEDFNDCNEVLLGNSAEDTQSQYFRSQSPHSHTFIQAFNIPNHDDLVPYSASNSVFVPHPNLNLSNHNIFVSHPDLNLFNHEPHSRKKIVFESEYKAAVYISERPELLKIANKMAQYDGLKGSDNKKPEVLTQQLRLLFN